MIEKAKKLFVVEYSISQDATHVRTLETLLTNNRHIIASGVSSDYAVIGLFVSRDDAERFVLDFVQQRFAKEAQLESGSRNWKRVSEIIDEISERYFKKLESEPRQE